MNLTIDISGRLMIGGKHATMTYSEGLLKLDFGSEELSLKELREVCARLERVGRADAQRDAEQATPASTARRARWLPAQAARERLGISPATLHRWRVERVLPSKPKPGAAKAFLYDVNNAPVKFARNKVPHDAR